MQDIHDLLDIHMLDEEKFFKMVIAVSRMAESRRAPFEEEDYIKFLNGSFRFRDKQPPNELITLLRQEISLILGENMI